jgi:hypothetical protein
MVVTVAATVPLTLWLGVTGPGVALCLGLIGDIAFTTSRVAPRLSTPLKALWPLRQRVALVAAFAAGYAAARAIDAGLPGLWGAAAGVIGGSALYAGTLIGVGGVSSADTARARGFVDLLRRRRPTLAA